MVGCDVKRIASVSRYKKKLELENTTNKFVVNHEIRMARFKKTHRYIAY